MDELLDILDANGNFTGTTAARSVAHRDGLFHNTVHIWFYTRNGNLLLQQRGRLKKTHPLLWDVSVAGHVSAGDSIENAAVREVKEEIGIDILVEDLQKLTVFKSLHTHANGTNDREFHHTFISELKVPFDVLQLEENEAEALKLLPISIFSNAIFKEKNIVEYVPHDEEYYRIVIDAISKIIALQ